MTCGYCQGSSFIQRGSGRGHQAPPSATVIRVQGSHLGLWWFFATLTIASVIGAGTVAFRGVVLNRNAIVFTSPLLFDIDADGMDELIVQATWPGSDRYHLRALDARTSDTVWSIDQVGSLRDTNDIIAVVGDTVVQVQSTKFCGYDARSGRPRFERPLPGRIRAVCESGDRGVLFTVDEKFYVLDPSSGELTPGEEKLRLPEPELPPCSPAWTTILSDKGRRVRWRYSTADPEVEGMYTTSVLTYVGDGDLPALLTGQNRHDGWQPMLAGVRDGATVWTSNMALDEPLLAKMNAPTGAIIAEGRVYATYVREQPESTQLVSLSLANGERYWEVTVSDREAHIQMRANRHHVFVLANGALHAFAATDGRHLWSYTR